MRTNEQELAEAQRLAHLGSWVFDLQANEIRWSDEAYRIFGMNREESVGTLESFMDAVHPDDRAKVQAALEASYKGDPHEVDHRVIRPDGEVRTVLERGYTELDAGGKPLRIFGTVHDITELRRMENSLRRFASILDSLPGIFYIYDEQGRLVQWNDRTEAVTGRSAEQLDGIDSRTLVPKEEQDRVAEAIAETFSEGSTVIESKLCTVEGDTPYLLNGLRIELNGQPYMLGIGLDIAKQKRLEVLLEREANTDTLTGLYNRQRFDAEVEHALALHARYGTETALVMIDLDTFKEVNDTYGHDVGDQVLVELTARLDREMRKTDFLFRWGGEEFAVLLPETSVSEAAQMAERLRECIEGEPFPEVGVMTISLGITSFRSSDTPNTLLSRVDAALYEAKRTGRNRAVVHDEDPGA